MKAVAISAYYITVMVDEFGKDSSSCMYWHFIARRLHCSDLQAMCIARVSKHVFPTTSRVLHPETWTAESKEYVPRAWVKKTPNEYGVVLLEKLLNYEIGHKLQRLWNSQFTHPDDVFFCLI